MTSPSELLAVLRAQGIQLRREGDKLKAIGEKSRLTPELRELVAAHKPALMALLAEVSDAAQDRDLPQLRAVGPGPHPLSDFQERLWFLEQVTPGTPVHTLGLALRWRGPLDVDAARAAFQAFVARHHVLRTRFEETPEGVKQTLGEPLADFETRDLRGAQDPEQALRDACHESFGRAFDLRAPSFVRCQVVLLGEHDYALLVIAHHLVWDGASNEIFRSEFVALYEAARRGTSAALPEVPVQYADFAAYVRELVQSPAGVRALEYWKKTFTPLPEPLDLPADSPRAEVRSTRGATLAMRLPEALVERLREAARKSGCTLQMLLLSGLAAVSSRFANQRDVVVALARDQRDLRELEGVVGPLVGTLPVRVQVEPEEAFGALLGRVRDATVGALSHSQLPFEKLVEALSPPRDTSRTPLYQVMFSYQERAAVGASPEGVELTEVPVPTGGAATDMFLWVGTRGTELWAVLDYAADLFQPETAQRFLDAWVTFLEAAAAAPERPVGKLPLLDARERARVLSLAGPQVVPLSEPLHQLVSAQAQRTPDARALVFEDQTLSYRELDERANQLAHSLVEHGLTPKQLVGVCVERSVDLIIAMLAVLKAGCAYVPLDPTYPRERLRMMAEDAELALIVTSTRALASLEGVVQPTFVLDERRDKIAAAPRSAPDVPVEMHDLMYVIYTSGSTGKPKGVMVEHRNVANFLVGMRERIGLLRGGVWLSATSVSFDISVLEIFGSLTHGFTLVLMGETQFGVASKEAYSLAAQLERHTVSHFQCTPSQALLLLADPEAKQALRHVQEMLIGGEALGLDLAKQLTACLGGRLINVYGPTETTIWSTTFEVPREPADVSLGTPIANTTLYVLDESLEPVPVGVAGELYIGGLGVARGYLRRDELTRERFLPDPFASVEGARMYKTGDLVRLRNDGSLAFLGRNDFQVKIRGFRVELGEIENALRSLAHAKHAVVVAQNDGKGDARLVAYYVPTEQTPGDLRSLREALRAELPEYMLPSVAVPLSELPLTGSGKVDRNRLPKPESSVVSTTAFVAPSSDLEQKLAECWKRVLKVDRVGVDDNFFDLGGHSLLMMRLVSEITQHCGVSVSIPDLFQAPNIRSLARKLTAQDAGPQAKAGAQAGAARREAARAVRGRRG